MELHSETGTVRLEDTMNRYDDIINLPHYEPHHKRMSMSNRAAQFAPFSALTGHNDAIAETARLTSEKIELTNEEKDRLSRRLVYALDHKMPVDITYFRPDQFKTGGAYVTVSGYIKKIDETEGLITLIDGLSISVHSVLLIEI